MVISHDRFFLDRICTHLLIMEGNGQTRWYEGNFTAYEKSVMAENPERLAHRRNKYQRLVLRSKPHAAGCQPASAQSSPLTAELAIMKQIASAISSG